MTDFGWTRLAYLLAVLSVLAALAQLGSPSAEPWPLASEPPAARPANPPTAERPHARASAAPRTNAAPRARSAVPAFAAHLKRATAAGAFDAPDLGRAIFYRPTPARPASGNEPSPGPVCGDLGRFPSGNRLVFPLPMQHASSFEDTWGAPRPQGGHEGTDLMVPTGTPEYAVTDGTVVPVAGSNGNGWNSLGGYAVMLRAAYSVGPVRQGDLFYYAHLDRESALPLGATVRAGQLVGYAGDTGQGPEVTRGLFPPHLHFGWYDATGTRSYLPSGAMNPYPLLEWLGASGVVGGGMGARYCEVLRNGAPTPSTGGDRWPAAREAGARPDLDTGTRRPAPSPAVGKAHSTVRAPVRAENPAPGAAAGPREAPAKTASGGEPRASRPPATAEKPVKPASSGQPPPRDAASGAERRPPAAGADPDGSGVPASNGPPEEAEPGLPGGEQGGEETGKGEDEDPGGGTVGHEPAGPDTGREEPAEEEPGGGPAPPGEETTPDEDESASEADEDPEPADPEDDGSEEPGGETPEEETTPEATTPE